MDYYLLYLSQLIKMMCVPYDSYEMKMYRQIPK